MNIAALTIPAIFTTVDRLTAPVRRMGAAMTGFAGRTEVAAARASRALNKMTAPLVALRNRFSMLGAGVGIFAGAAVVVNAINVIKDFEQAQANLAAILGVTRKQTVKLSADAMRLGAITKFTAAQVSDLQTAYAKLGFTQNEILSSTEPTLSLAAATNTELAQAATQVGSALRAFGLDASKAAMVSDVFAAASSKSALDMEKLATGMGLIAPVAKQFGFTVQNTTALLGKLSDAGFDASTAATSTRKILLNLADANGELAKKLGAPVRSLPELIKGLKKLKSEGVDLGKMLQLTDVRSVAAFATFIDNADAIQDLSDALDNSLGFAAKTAATQLDTLGGSLTILQSAYQGFILSMDNGNGTFSKSLRFWVDTTADMLSLSSGTAKAAYELNFYESRVRDAAESMKTILSILWFSVKAWLAVWAITKVVTASLWAYRKALIAVEFAQGILTVMNGKYATSCFATAAGMNGMAFAAFFLETSLLGLVGVTVAVVAALATITAGFINGYDASVDYVSQLKKTKDGFYELAKPLTEAQIALQLYNKEMEHYRELQNYAASIDYRLEKGGAMNYLSLVYDQFRHFGMSQELRIKTQNGLIPLIAPTPEQFGIKRDATMPAVSSKVTEQNTLIERIQESSQKEKIELSYNNMPSNVSVAATAGIAVRGTTTMMGGNV